MAKLSSDGKSVTVERGDTLSEIAQKYCGGASKYKQLAAINNISNPNKIYVGQVIKLTSDASGSGSSGSGSSGSGGSGSSSSTTSKPAANTNQAVVEQFGLQSDAENTLFAVWRWEKTNVEHYEVMWYYDTGDHHWFVGNDSTVKYNESTYNIPSNANQVKFKVKPISKTYTSNDKETSYWTAEWSTEKIYSVKNSPPEQPSTPSIEIEKYTLTSELNNLADDIKVVQFQVVKNNKNVYKTVSAVVTTGHASISCTVEAGNEYKVRCRTAKTSPNYIYGNISKVAGIVNINEKYLLYGEWSEYSDNKKTLPATPTGIKTLKATSETSVYLEWDAVTTAKTYEIEYTTEKRYFDGSNQTTTQSNIEFTHYELTGLETGDEYFFRIRAVNTDGDVSGWSEIKSIAIGSDPAAPTTWSSTTTVITGEPLNLYWVHNAEDGSSQTYAELELIIDGVSETQTIKNSEDEEEKDKTSVYAVDTSNFIEGTKIQWRVRTAGATKAYGDWSVQRTVDVYAPPTLELSVTNIDGDSLSVLESFPFYVYGLAGPNTQMPIGYQLTITSNEMYETVDSVGNIKMVNSGEQVYSKYFDISEELLVEFTPSIVDLENNINYTVSCTVTMNSGLTTEATSSFTIGWTETGYTPNASISIDEDILAAYIRPYCEIKTSTIYKVEVVNDIYTKTEETLNSVWGEPVENANIESGETVYFGMTDEGEEVYYCTVESTSLAEDVSLAVYRREYDGSFVELATGLDNSRNTFITDPHPSLDLARYRIVATTNSTGAVGFYDVPGIPMGVSGVVIQWNESWSEFETNNEDAIEEQPWSGSFLLIPYNIDVSDSNSLDVSLIEYIGRKHPVSYYGTHVGEKSSWSMVIPKDDKDTLYGLRRLAKWMGDVYVREPSGTGYWANISVSFSQKHLDVTIPVSLSITRVEGGI